MKLTGMASGSLYPMLARLERAGWLIRGKEDIDQRAAGRPARTNYTITGAAVNRRPQSNSPRLASSSARPARPSAPGGGPA